MLNALRIWTPALLLSIGVALVCLTPSLLPAASGELARRWIMLACAFWALLLCAAQADNGPHRRSWLGLVVLLYLLAHALSTALALHRFPALIGSNERGLGLLSELAWWALVLVSMRLVWQLPARVLLRPMAVIAIALSLWALLQFAWTGGAARSTAALGNPLFLASVLAMTLPLHLLAGIWPGWRWSWTLFALQLLALLSTGGRAALLAALIALLLGYAAQLPRRRALAVLAAGALSIALLGAAVAQWRPASLSIRGELYAAALSGAQADQALQSSAGQVDPWADWRTLLGYGPEGVEPVLTRHRSARLNSAELEHAGWDRWADRSHSRVLDRLLEGGLLGLALAGLLVAMIGWRLRPRLAAGSDPTGRAMALGLLIWWLDGLVGVPSAAADLVAALLLGMGIGLCREPAPGATPPRRPWVVLPMSLALTGLLLGSFAALLWAHGLLAKASISGSPASPPIALALRWQPYSALASMRALQEQLNNAETADLGQLQQWSRHATAAAPSVPRVWLLSGEAAALAGDPASAAVAWARGLSLLQTDADIDHQQRLQIAVALSRSAEQLQQQGQIELANEAFQAARQALEIAQPPSSAAWWATLAWLRAREQDYPGAIVAYRKALAIDPDNAASERNLRRLEAMAEQTRTD